MNRDEDREEETDISDPSSIASPREDNCRTLILPLEGEKPRPRKPPLDAHTAFLAVYERMRAAAANAPERAVVANGVDNEGKLVALSVLESGRVLTIGRHSQCAFRLPARDVSLRHLAMHVALGEDGAVTRLWDLKSGQPFETEDGTPSAAVIGEGPLFVAVGRYALLFVPKTDVDGGRWPVRAADAWRTLAPRQFLERKCAAQPAPAAPAPAEWRPAGTSRTISRITRMGAPALLGAEDVLAGPVWAELTVEDMNGKLRHKVSAEQIDRGVLVGRSSRCQVGIDGDHALSRVHLLVVRIGDEVWAIDTASTNGTKRTGCDVEAVVLRDRDTLQLANVAALHWKRLVVAAA